MDAAAAIKQSLADTARAYAAIFFLDNPLAGILLLAGTFVYPNIGVAGLLAALTGALIVRVFNFPKPQRSSYILNSLLVGLSVGAFYQVNIHACLLILAGAVLAIFVSAALADTFWRQERLPVLVIPFLLVATVTSLVARKFGALTPAYEVTAYAASWLPHWAHSFLSLLGATFFTVHPLAGAIVLLTMLWRSRYLALLACMGALTGHAVLLFLGAGGQPLLTSWAGFNLVLTAIAIGGIYTIPGLASFATAMLAVALSAVLIIACQDLLFVYGLPVVALPFIAITSIFLLALRTRFAVTPPRLAPEPGMPEQNYERARLARVRDGDLDSVPLLLPLLGRWQIYQSFDGEHTHIPPWQHALDFYVTEDAKSFATDGVRLEDFYCFGLPVFSPAYGRVIRLCNYLADNKPGEVDTENNWGNFVLIQLDSGLHVLLAHLKQNSIKVNEGERVEPGKPLGACGNSGRSPQPHVHLQVQRSAELGSHTHPFHLCSLLRHKADGESEYCVHTRPAVGETIEAAIVDQRLANPLHLPVGRQLTYQIEGPGIRANTLRRFQVELTLLGQFRLVSDTGASAAFTENNGVLAFYDRQGPKDVVLDIWLLANGLTPLSEAARHWTDAASAHLMPLDWRRRAMLHLLHPLGCGLDSSYQRYWHGDHGAWLQQGKHGMHTSVTVWRAQTESRIDPQQGFSSITCVCGAQRWHAQLTELGLASDQGIPGWRVPHTSQQEQREISL